MGIDHIPKHLRPREKAQRLGFATLSDTEIIALFLGTGTQKHHVMEVAENLLKSLNGVQGLLHATIHQLKQIEGIHTAKATELLALAELHRRIARTSINEIARIETPQEVYQLLVPECIGLTQEVFFGIFLNARHQLIAYKSLFTGTVNGAMVHPRDLFREAIARNAASIIIAHNHPTGDTTPSDADRHLTERLLSLGKELAIPVLDHVIIGADKYYSFVENQKKIL